MSQSPQNHDDHDGLTFEVVEDEHHESGQKNTSSRHLPIAEPIHHGCIVFRVLRHHSCHGRAL